MKKIWALICAIALVLCIAAGVVAVQYSKQRKVEEEVIIDLQAIARKDTPTTEEPEDTTDSADSTENSTEAEVPAVEIPINFEALQAINPEIYAWITVPGTNIDYPLLQCPHADSFYLSHDATEEPSVAGAIYTETLNNKYFTDFNTVIYGHNMKDGSMFATLHKFRDRSFFDENREFVIYTPYHIYHYLIFAAYKTDNKHILKTWDFTRIRHRFEYLDTIYNQHAMDAYILEDPVVTMDDFIVTLSTCINDPASRYLVQGVLQEIE